eukprot:CAMPEP_0115034224 /NCGR_PEP_ID=MMETSP0216-20121206/40501_1 /TAXON_ID=223996 /ORGANISM="Protocruzia adherens, Strain Boccale" /LENGTH=224 /DNA_ID=CAMNT_0002413023 /DNA_START=252 /DNA_END=926 /DNA_ORIENTATION=-
MTDAYNLLYDYQHLKTVRKGLEELSQAEVETLPQEEIDEYNKFLAATEFESEELNEPFAIYEYMLQRRNAQLLFGTLLKPTKKKDEDALSRYMNRPVKKAKQRLMALVNARDEESLDKQFEKMTNNEQEYCRSLRKIIKNVKEFTQEQKLKEHEWEKRYLERKQADIDEMRRQSTLPDDVPEEEVSEETLERMALEERKRERSKMDALERARKEFQEYKNREKR